MVKNIRYDNNGVVSMVSKEELYQIKASLSGKWSLEQHFAELSQQHTDYFDSLIRELGYIDRADVNMTALFINTYQDEAIDLVKFWTKSYSELEDYKEADVTEENKLTLHEIITPYE